MGFFGESESEREIREHNEGQEAGSKASLVEQLGQSLFRGIGTSEAYDKGFDNGVKNPSED